MVRPLPLPEPHRGGPNGGLPGRPAAAGPLHLHAAGDDAQGSFEEPERLAEDAAVRADARRDRADGMAEVDPMQELRLENAQLRHPLCRTGAGLAGGRPAASARPRTADPRIQRGPGREKRIDPSAASRSCKRCRPLSNRPRPPARRRPRRAAPGRRPVRGRAAGPQRGAGTRTPTAAGGRAGGHGSDARDGDQHGPRTRRDGPATQRLAAAAQRGQPRSGASGTQQWRRLLGSARRPQGQAAETSAHAAAPLPEAGRPRRPQRPPSPPAKRD